MKTINGKRRTKKCEEHAKKTLELCQEWLKERRVPDEAFIDFMAYRMREMRSDWEKDRIG